MKKTNYWGWVMVSMPNELVYAVGVGVVIFVVVVLVGLGLMILGWVA